MVKRLLSTLRSHFHSGRDHRAAANLAIHDGLGDFSADRRLLLVASMALAVGAAGAGAAWALLHLIDLVTNIAYFGVFGFAHRSIADSRLGWWAALVPVAGCLIIGLMARFGSEKIRGHGIPEAMEAILIGRSRIEPKVALLKPLSSALSIGTGGPFGAEGPIIMTGGALGSLFAQLFQLSSSERKTLLVAGAAAGMSATFATPVAGMLLAVELLLFEWKPRSFVPVALASVVAAALRPWLIAPGPLFPMAPSPALPALGLLVCAGVGIVSGLASGLLTAMVYKSEDLFQRLPIHWMWWPLIGGAAVGLGGLIEPHALSVGYDNIAALLQGNFSRWDALSLLVVKSLIWAIALGSGTSGGVLAPLLMMGGSLAALMGNALPFGTSATWALIGMAAIMAGTMRSPLTATVFALELTGDLSALVPLAIACAVAHGTTVLLLKRSILTEKVARRGYHVLREYTVDPFATMRISEIMAQPVDTLPDDTTVGEAVTFFTTRGATPRHKSYPVIRGDSTIAAMVARADALLWTVETPPSDKPLTEQLAGQELVTAYEDELVGRVADRMAETGVGRVPILRRGTDALVGIVARRDLLRVRASVLRQERERETLISLPGRRRSAAR